MNESRNESRYRALLEAAQKGLEHGKAFIEAIESSDEAARDDEVRTRVQSLVKHLDDLEKEADQLWDHFKRLNRPDLRSGITSGD